MPSLKKAAVLAAASLTALALAACGQQTGSTGTTEESKPQSVLALLASDAVGSLKKTADTTAKSTSVTLTMTGTASGQKVQSHGVVALTEPRGLEMTVQDPSEGEITVRMVGDAIFVQVPKAQQAMLQGKKWLKMDLGGKDSAEMAKQFDDMDPAKGVQRLLDGTDVTVVGTETIDGVQTVHYATTGSVDSYLGQVDTKLRKETQASLEKAGVKEIKTDLWVDEQYRPRRVHMVMGAVSDFTIEYSDYDKPVTVTAPPAGEVTDLSQLLGNLPK
ncbi:LppX_LprAFG lipoprotein [Plantactinospora sp. KBS50]|uniref:LppX_LprAFG lipoprotein n=1 Tax=Plantactinospora sp. KBS50 TaxID=2024580 RepID=UPI000BAAD5B4|nr:LppX_LprAFG lipoprotein [Plantactinospora sp. KBS50]ASW55320.1 hypothetical protein CIK06_15795 [Plantactinospora sp. KBS50]